LDYVGNRREMEERNSVSIGSPIVQNETASTHWLSAAEQTSKRQDQDIRMALGKDRGKVVRVWWAGY
jgi:hypothetical protein